MSRPARHHRYTFADYLSVEKISTVKHEFLDSEIYAMAGGSILHAALSAAVSGSFLQQLETRSRVLSSDLRVRVVATGLVTYPDVTLVCGPIETDPVNRETVTNPTVVVEVLSPSTFDYDLGDKFDHYKQIPALTSVVFVWQDRAQIEVRARQPDGTWTSSVALGGQHAHLPFLSASLDVDRIYRQAGGPA